MDQVIAERPLSQEQQLSQLQGQHNGTVDTSTGHHLLDLPLRQHPGNFTGLGRTNFNSGSTNGGIKGDKDSRAICRDNLRGLCARGLSCKFRHSDCEIHAESNFTNEHRYIETAADTRNSQIYPGIEDGDPQKMSLFTEHKTRSPCRKFQSGTCYRGSRCPHLHSVCPNYNGVGAASTNRVSHEGNLDNKIETWQGRDMQNKENNLRSLTFSREPRSRSPCRNFLRGNCRFGSFCRRLHSIDEYNHNRSEEGPHRFAVSDNRSFGCRAVEISSREQYKTNHHSQFRSGSFQAVSRRGNLCQYFLRGSCIQGRACVNVHPATVYKRTTYDFDARQGSIASSQYHRFDERNLAGDLRIHGMQPCRDNLGRGTAVVNDINQNEHHKSWLANEQLAHNRGSLSVTPRRWSSERPQSKPDSELGHEKPRPEVCLRFTKGRCANGEFCKYLHSYHEYASSVSQQNRGLQAEGSADILSTGGAIKSAVSLVVQGQSSPGSEKMSSSDKIFACTGGSFGDETKADSVDDAVKQNANITLQVTSQRRRSRSPFSSENDFRLRKVSQNDSHGGYPRRRCCHGAQIQCPHCQPANYDSPDYHINKQHASVAATSLNPSSNAKDDSSVMAPQEHSEMPSYTMQFDSVASGSARSGTAIVCNNIKEESSANSLLLSHENKNDTGLDIDNKVVDISEGATALIHESLVPDLKSPGGENLISPVNGTIVLEKEYLAGRINSVCHEGKEPVEKIQDLKTYLRKRKWSPQSSSKCLESVTDEAADTSQKLPIPSSVEGTFLDHQGGVSVSGMSGVTAEVTIVKVQDDVVEASSAATPISRRKLLVLDVNGLLADIVGDFPDRYRPDTTISGKGVFKRPFSDDFMQFCFERFDVGIWSSRTERNVNRVVDFLLKNNREKLLFCWDQSHCTGTGYKTVENQDKPLVLKELKKLWENRGDDLPWKKGFYNEINTVLLDDSPYKALRNPPYTAVFPFPYSYADKRDNSLGPDGDLRLYLTRLAEAENVQTFIKENPFGQRRITKKNLSWAFYSRIAGKYASEQE